MPLLHHQTQCAIITISVINYDVKLCSIMEQHCPTLLMNLASGLLSPNIVYVLSHYHH